MRLAKCCSKAKPQYKHLDSGIVNRKAQKVFDQLDDMRS